MKGNVANHGVGLLLAVPLFGMAFPYGFPLFPLVVVTVLSSIVYYSYGNALNLKVKPYLLMLFCLSSTLCYLVYFYDVENYIVRSESLSTIVLLVAAICFTLTQTSKSTALDTLNLFNKHYVNAVLIVCLLSVLKAVLMILDVYVIDKSIAGTSLSIDYNMYSLAILIAAVICTFEDMTKLRKVTFLTIFSVCIILSTSRRGAILLLALLCAILVYMLYCWFRYINSRFIKNAYITIVLGVITIVTPTYYVFSAINNYELPESLRNQEVVVIDSNSNSNSNNNIEDVPIKIGPIIEFDYVKRELSAQREKISNRIKTILSTGNTGVVYQRVIRLEQSKELFYELSLIKKLFGSGYYYHFYFQNKNNLTGLDYPHNILLSTFFSQGYFGVLILLLIFIATTRNTVYLFKQKGAQWLMFANILFIFYMVTGGDTLVSNKYYIVFSLFSSYLFTAFRNEKFTSNTNSV